MQVWKYCLRLSLSIGIYGVDNNLLIAAVVEESVIRKRTMIQICSPAPVQFAPIEGPSDGMRSLPRNELEALVGVGTWRVGLDIEC